MPSWHPINTTSGCRETASWTSNKDPTPRRAPIIGLMLYCHFLKLLIILFLNLYFLSKVDNVWAEEIFQVVTCPHTLWPMAVALATQHALVNSWGSPGYCGAWDTAGLWPGLMMLAVTVELATVVAERKEGSSWRMIPGPRTRFSMSRLWILSGIITEQKYTCGLCNKVFRGVMRHLLRV